MADLSPSPLRSSTSSAMTSMLANATAGASSKPDSSMGKFGGVLLATLRFTLGLLLWVVTFITITLPTFLFTFTSTGLTITMNATTVYEALTAIMCVLTGLLTTSRILIALVVLSTISWFVRYRFLNMYARLPPEPQRKEPQVELFPEVPDGDSKRGFSSYIDEFLSAIKVFGYLERPVFHELTRTMQTRKLIAGETILLEEEQGFCLVVDGLVQIFVKSSRHQRPYSNSDESMNEDDEEHAHDRRQGYQLLTEVKNGAPLSSLFSILALFTEDVKLRYDEEEASDSRPASASFQHSEPNSPQRSRRSRQQGSFNASFNSGKEGTVPPFSLDGSASASAEIPMKQNDRRKSSKRRKRETVHPEVVARATVDTTIAIIPATAFRRLTRTYPKASSHIVQVILTRLQRVTLSTGHAYLGLTSEVLSTEKLMNKFTTFDLPGFLRGSALERLKEKFSTEKETLGPEEVSKGIALHNPKAHLGRRSSNGLRKDAVAQARFTASRQSSQISGRDHPLTRLTSMGSDNTGVNAGDLLAHSNGGPQKGTDARGSYSQPFHTVSSGSEDPHREQNPSSFGASARSPFPPQRQESRDEDVFFRDSIVDCMLKAIGLTDAQGALQKADSVPQSPHLVSYDSRRQKAFFSNAFGLMDALNDGDSESMTSIPASTVSATGSVSIQDELSNDVEIVYFPQGSVLVEQGERNPGLYYVIDGFLDVSVPEEVSADSMTYGAAMGVHDLASEITSLPSRKTTSPKRTKAGLSRERSSKKNVIRKSLYLTKPGGLAGYLGTISSRRSFVDITAKTDVYVGFLPRASIEHIVEKYPIVLLTMAKRLTTLLPRLILHIDFALEWVQVDAGQAIFRQGDDSDAIYIVLNGRLRNLRTGSDDKTTVIGEYGQGDSVGELEVLTESPRPGTLHAIRDTELAKLPKTLFNSLALENPEITIKISKIIATRMRDLTEAPRLDNDRTAANSSLATSTVNLRTVAILPVTTGVPVVEFGSRLLNSLSQIGVTNGVTSLNQAAILNHLGRHAFSRMGKLKLSQHLADLEEKFGLVLYVADTNVNSPWTQTCISQADCILLVGLAEGPHAIGEYERLLIGTKTTARKELVLLHAERYCPPGLTRKWLRNRMWINGSHHHIHMTFRNTAEPVHPQTRRFGSALKQRVQVLQAEIQKYTSRRIRQAPMYGYSAEQTPFKGDFHRLARRLVGKSVGLVLGGGGARGLAHIGIIRALEEAGIPIDIVGGTSIGAFVGALYAWDADLVPLYGRAKKFAGRMASMWRFALDLTYPSASYTTGHEFNRGIFKTFGTAQMEDFWLECYCNTTNISKSRSEIHTSGYAWRYVRASMSLAGLVPPLCDEGSLLVDGGYLDNLTVSHMKSLGASLVFAVDVGALDDDAQHYYGDSLSGLWATLNRWNPWSAYANPPTLSEIQARLAYVSSVDALERAKITAGVRYMRPPVEGFGTLEFGRFEELVRVGAEYARGYLRDMREGRIGGGGGGGGAGGNGGFEAWGGMGLGGANGGEALSGEERRMRRTMAPRRASI